MIITVKHSSEEDQEFELEKFPVIIGRGSDCDIVISSDHISRKHLEIQNQEEKVFIKDLTLSNWISYNNEKLPKGEYIQYYDFAPLILPSGHELSFEISENEKLKLKESDKTSTGKVDIYGNRISPINTDKVALETKLRTTTLRHTKIESESKTGLIVSIAILAIVLGYIFYDVYEGSLKGSTVVINKESKILSRQTLFKMLKSDKCLNQVMKSLCDSILPNWRGEEGVIEFKKNLFVFKSYPERLLPSFVDPARASELKLKKDAVLKISAVYRVMTPEFLSALNKRSVEKVYIIIFKNSASDLEILKTYKVDTSHYKNFSQVDYLMAFDLIEQSSDMRIFNEKLSDYIQEVKGI